MSPENFDSNQTNETLSPVSRVNTSTVLIIGALFAIVGILTVFTFRNSILAMFFTVTPDLVAEEGLADQVRYSIYGEPDPDYFSQLRLPEIANSPRSYDSLFLSLENSTMSELVVDELRLLLEKLYVFESYFIEEVGTVMNSVRDQAAAGEYLSMFGTMREARKINETGIEIASDLRQQTERILELNLVNLAPVEEPVIQTITSETQSLVVDATELMNLNLSLLRGSPPRQDELDQIIALTLSVRARSDILLIEVENLLLQ